MSAKKISLKTLTVVKPALGRVALQMLSPEEVTESGILLVTQNKIESNAGLVVATCEAYESASGDDDTGAPAGPMYTVGQVVVIGAYQGVEITLNPTGLPIDRQKVVIVRESDVLCILEEASNAIQ